MKIKRTRIDAVRTLQLRSFGYKVGTLAKEILERPTQAGADKFRKLLGEYVEEILHDYNVLLNQVEKQVKEDLTKTAISVVKEAILISTGGNSASLSPRAVKIFEDAEDATIKDITVLAEISIPTVQEEGTRKGTRRPSMNTTSTTQKLHQKVSTLRRIYFWKGILDVEAEKMIDAILEKAGVTGFKKYNRRKNYVYKEVIFKK